MRSSTLGATAATCRSPRSGGNRRRRGRALRAWSRLKRSIRCNPHDTPSARRPRHLHLARLHLAVARECLLRIVSKPLNPAAQLGLMYAQVFRRLRVRHAAFLDQAYRLELELSRKLPSLHDPPPAPSKHLTRCLRNRVRASSSFAENLVCSIASF